MRAFRRVLICFLRGRIPGIRLFLEGLNLILGILLLREFLIALEMNVHEGLLVEERISSVSSAKFLILSEFAFLKSKILLDLNS